MNLGRTRSSSGETAGTASIVAWDNQHAVAMLIGSLLSLWLASPLPVLVAAGALFFLYGYRHRSQLASQAPYGGLANWVTALRLLLVFVAAALMHVLSSLWMFALFGLSALLDVVDGFLARKFDQTSSFGAYFDMEADAFFVLMLGFYFSFVVGIGIWILIPGLLRYMYCITVWLAPKAGFEERPRRLATWLAGITFCMLVTSIVLPRGSQLAVLVLSASLLCASFLISFWEYFRHADDSSLLQ